MAIEKPLYSDMPEPESDVSIVVENPDSVSLLGDDEALTFDFTDVDPEIEFSANLAEYISDDELSAIASNLVSDYEGDERSRDEWMSSYSKGMELLGLKFEDRTSPWDGACGVFHPLLTESIVRFQSQSIQEIFPASGPAKTQIVGVKSNEKMEQARRVEEYLNYTATKTMKEYRDETERLLFSLPIAGSAFRKVYHDANKGREAAMFVPAEDFVVANNTSSLENCPRATMIMKRTPNQVRKSQWKGTYRMIDLPDPAPDAREIEQVINRMTGEGDNYEFDGRHTLLEMHVELDLPGFEDVQEGEMTGIELPYVVTIDKTSRTILSIRRNWYEEDPNKNRRDYFVHYQYIPGLGFYGFGLVHMIGGLSKSATSLLRQLVDAGTLANLPAGLKTRGLRIKGDDTPLAPGEFRDVDVPGGSIRDNISFLPYKEPSGVLYQLLQDIVQEGRRFASAADVKASDMNGEAPVGTTLAILEREMKVMSAIQARLHRSMGQELQLLADCLADYGPDKYPYEVEGDFSPIDDLDGRVDVIPVSDPNAGTMAQRIMTYQAALQLSAQAPHMYDLPLLHRQMLEVLGVSDAEKIVPTEEDLFPTDPITENQNILNGKPVKAHLHQDHEAHIQAHTSMLQNPQIMGLMEKNPKAGAIQAAMADHITEHVALGYRMKVEQELGMKLPDQEQPLPHDVETRLAQLVAPAAQQLTGKAQKMQQAQENAEKQKDPVIQLQQKKVELEEKRISQQGQEKMERIKNEGMRLQNDMLKHRDKLQFDYDEMERKHAIEVARLADKAQSDDDRRKLEEFRIRSQAELEGFRQSITYIDRIIDAQLREEEVRRKDRVD